MNRPNTTTAARKTPGRRPGRATAARVTSRRTAAGAAAAARSSGRRSRTKKNQPFASQSPFSNNDNNNNNADPYHITNQQQYQNHYNQHHNHHHHHPSQRTARSWTLFDTPLGGAGLIVPMWVPVDTLTVEQKEQHFDLLKQRMRDDLETQQRQEEEGKDATATIADLPHPEPHVVSVPEPVIENNMIREHDASTSQPLLVDPALTLDQQEESGPPRKRQKTEENQNTEPDGNTAASSSL